MDMYESQEFLPRLPLPTLEETCDRYLQTVAPLLSETELTQTQSAVRVFVQKDGPKLQKQLEMLAHSTNTSYLHELYESWLCEFRVSRLSSGWLNFGMVLSPIPDISESPVTRGATVIHNLLKFYLKVKRRELKPDQNVFRSKRQPLCMAQYDNIFGISWIPGLRRDSRVRTAKAEHIVVIRQNKFYSLRVLKGKELLSIAQIEAQLEWILKHTTPGEPALGALTALPRTEWAVLRFNLAAIAPENTHSLSLLDSALFVVCLDETADASLENMVRIAVYGDGRNRWFDKSLQLIVTDDGQLATNHDHIGIDGYTAMRLIAEISNNLQYRDDATPTFPTSDALELPVPLEWSLTPEILEAIAKAETTVDALIAQDQMRVWEFTEFGADLLKQNNLVPEAAVQLSLQLAYSRLHGEIASCSQAVHMRHFRYGRFEDLRLMSTESVEFIRSFTESNSDEVRLAAMRRAVQAYLKRLKAAKDGKNVESHLFALENLAHYQGEVPEIFQDKSYTEVFGKAKVVTTSLAAGMSIAAFGFGFCGAQGRYEVGYLIDGDKITFFAISRYDEQIGKYIQFVEQSLLELGELMTRANAL